MLASLIGAFVSGEALNMLQRVKSAAILYVVAAILFVIGAGFLVGAGYVAVARELGSITAAIVFGAGFIALGAIILIAKSIATSMRKRRSSRRAFDLATIAGATVVTALPLLIRRGGMAGLLAPLVAFAAYAIYRESRRDQDDDRPERRDE
jgi:hypothetical protein